MQPKQFEGRTTDLGKAQDYVQMIDRCAHGVFKIVEKMQEDRKLMAMVEDHQLRS